MSDEILYYSIIFGGVILTAISLLIISIFVIRADKKSKKEVRKVEETPMEDKNIEEKKLEIEKLKVKEGLFRTIVLIILTAGAGFGTVLYKQYSLKAVNNFALIILGTVLIIFFVIALGLWMEIRNKIKRL